MSSTAQTPPLLDFWSTPEGLNARVDAIAHNLIYGAANKFLLLMAGQLIPFDEEAFDWSTQNDDACEECKENEDEGPYLADDVPEFPAHPNCRCQVEINTFALGEAV